MGIEPPELTVMTAWGIWFNRNKTGMGATCQTSHEIMAKAPFLLMEYQEAHLRPTQFKDAEAKALDEASIFAWDVGVKDVIFETNSSLSHMLLPPPRMPRLLSPTSSLGHAFDSKIFVLLSAHM
uniref:Uncharacterized protein n=1 Tax=Quercus lobata TaxID=97700 RepID=A0A7N2MKN1_QUELO